MKAVPRLSVGLPVYNGAEYLTEALDSLLGQSYRDFELVISDNASTDETSEICRRYAAQDSRIRYFLQQRNIGASPNHNFVFEQSRGEFFKWTSCDDLYGRDLLLRCVEALDANPGAVLSHGWYGIVHGRNSYAQGATYALGTDSVRPLMRFRSLLFDVGGEDMYGVIRSDVLRRTPLLGSYHPVAERPLVAELSLHGTFYQVPEYLAFRREHADRAGAVRIKRDQCTIRDPRRQSRVLHPALRLNAEYVWAFVAAVWRAPLSITRRAECYRTLAGYVATRLRRSTFRGVAGAPECVALHGTIDLSVVVPGQGRKSS